MKSTVCSAFFNRRSNLIAYFWIFVKVFTGLLVLLLTNQLFFVAPAPQQVHLKAPKKKLGSAALVKSLSKITITQLNASQTPGLVLQNLYETK